MACSCKTKKGFTVKNAAGVVIKDDVPTELKAAQLAIQVGGTYKPN